MKTLIILHGWKSSKEKWQAVKEHLDYEVIIPDLPGFKTELDRAWTLDDYVQWLNSSYQKENFFLLGHSFGARIAIKFAEKHGNRLNGLILVSAAGIKRHIPVWRFLSKRFKLKFLRTLFYRYVLRRTDYLNAQGFLKQTMVNVINEDLTPLLEKISVPTHIIWGKKDKQTPLKHGYLMKDKIGATMDIINTGHAPYIENPKLLADKIKQFIC